MSTGTVPQNDDTIPDSYPYFWSPEESKLTIEEFVAKYKPSMIQNDGTKPWLWVRNSNDKKGSGTEDGAIEEATKLVAEVTETVEKIKNDDSIPTRSNKKTGTKSKKELREQAQSEATARLKEIHQRYGYTIGKWLIFAPPDKIDSIWARIAVSVATGPLSKTTVGLAKASTTPMNESPAQRLICVYIPDVFNEPQVTEVMRILLRNHGVNLSGVKSDLYTLIGLDSKHPSGISSTIWKNSALMKEAEIKELKEAFFSELKSDPEKTGGGSKPLKAPAKPRDAEDDPFASDGDEEDDLPKTVPKRKKGVDHEHEDEPKSKAQKK